MVISTRRRRKFSRGNFANSGTFANSWQKQNTNWMNFGSDEEDDVQWRTNWRKYEFQDVPKSSAKMHAHGFRLASVHLTIVTRFYYIFNCWFNLMIFCERMILGFIIYVSCWFICLVFGLCWFGDAVTLYPFHYNFNGVKWNEKTGKHRCGDALIDHDVNIVFLENIVVWWCTEQRVLINFGLWWEDSLRMWMFV